MFDADYINNEMSWSDIYVNELLLETDVGESGNVICLCREADILHIIRFEKKKNSYEFLERYQIDPEKLSDNYTESIEFIKPFVTASKNKYYIYAAVFTDPESDSLMINGEETQVNKVSVKLNGKEYRLGVWAKSFLEKTTLSFE